MTDAVGHPCPHASITFNSHRGWHTDPARTRGWFIWWNVPAEWNPLKAYGWYWREQQEDHERCSLVGPPVGPFPTSSHAFVHAARNGPPLADRWEPPRP